MISPPSEKIDQKTNPAPNSDLEGLPTFKKKLKVRVKLDDALSMQSRNVSQTQVDNYKD